MITSCPNAEQLNEWRRIWEENRDLITPDRKNGQQLIDYLHAIYELDEIIDQEISDVISGNITDNPHSAQKLPENAQPLPRAYYVKNTGSGRRLYERRNEEEAEVSRILVGVDTVSGCYHVEGSCLLWDELCAYQGLDESDLSNFVCTAMYVLARGRRCGIIGSHVTVDVDRPMDSLHPRHSDMVYPINYGFVSGVKAQDGDEQDAYLLGINEPVNRGSGIVAAVVVREDDVEDKWVVVPEEASYSPDEIMEAIAFQEKFFRSRVVTDPKYIVEFCIV